ncbi:hypothetical protein M885DRAFT_541898 [Pelagophyceae sp. CCMP2097]|nr:hypothetical protein M885DRAFT_541898 [Pelagophyceae sp. CCMP2097]
MGRGNLLRFLVAAFAACAAFRPPSNAAGGVARRAGSTCRGAVQLIEVCQKKHCKKRGAAQTLAIFQALAGRVDGLAVQPADMSHTDHGCFDECTEGPNVRVDGEPGADGGKVFNGIDSAQKAAEMLGIELEKGWALGAP